MINEPQSAKKSDNALLFPLNCNTVLLNFLSRNAREKTTISDTAICELIF